jgi:leader peptidase (prepilin peptidase)/N-methyltransferase
VNWLIIIIGFITGTVIGSFSEATSERLTSEKSLRGRSYCASCKHQLGWYDLFPVLSYLFLRGKCRYCKRIIPQQNFITEIISGAVFALFFAVKVYPQIPLFNLTLSALLPSLEIAFQIFFLTVLIIVFLTDIKKTIIPDKVIFPSIAVTLIYFIATNAFKTWQLYLGLSVHPIGKYLLPPYSDYYFRAVMRMWQGLLFSAVTGIGLAAVFGLLIIITRGKGMGGGDVKYVLLLGLALGFPNGILAVFIAFLTGALFSVALIIFGKKHFGQTIPFGPFLSIGAFIALLYGNQIIDWYLKGFRI